MLSQTAPLYTGEVPIDPALSADQNALQALEQVLTRLTGITAQSVVAELGLGPAVLRQLVSSEQRVRRALLGPEDQALPDEVRLRIDFDPAGVDALLANAGLPRLGHPRPSVLLWLAVEDASGVSLQGSAFLEQEINEQARRLGLDIIRPLGDLIDLADIDSADIRGGVLDAGESSMRRYGAQVIAMLDLRRLDADWSANWFWRLERQDSALQQESEALSGLVAVGLENILSALAERFAVRAGVEAGGQRRIVVRGIQGEVQYAEVLRHLNALSAVEHVLVTGARGNEVEFLLQLRSPGLEDGLRIGGILGIENQRADGSLELRLLR
ncbi:MAG: DUF2066 domain-containing protein [Wenzhouxiangella sp.]